jgi:FixJ family two-component response regulator
MKEPPSIVFIVEDDSSMRNALNSLLESVGLAVESFASGKEFLQYDRPDVPACAVLDVRLPGLSGFDVQRELTKANLMIPIIFITAHGDIPMSVRAMKAGAVEFLTKPFRDQDLLDAIHLALEKDRVRWEQGKEIAVLQSRLDSLTMRERELLPLLLTGLPNKQIAAAVGTSESNLKVHRGNVIRKMQAQSLADLIRIAGKLNITAR